MYIHMAIQHLYREKRKAARRVVDKAKTEREMEEELYIIENLMRIVERR